MKTNFIYHLLLASWMVKTILWLGTTKLVPISWLPLLECIAPEIWFIWNLKCGVPVQIAKKKKKKNSIYILEPKALTFELKVHFMTRPSSADIKCNLDSEKNKDNNKNHSENADTSTSVTFNLVVWPWPFVIRCRFLYCTLVPRI